MIGNISKINVGDSFRFLNDQQFSTIDSLGEKHIAFTKNYDNCIILDKNKYYITILTSFNFVFPKSQIIRMIPLDEKVKVEKIK